MPNENQTTIGAGILIAITSIFVAVISVGATLLLSNMETIRGKADKADAADRWTRTMQSIKEECDKEKEGLREEREVLRDAAASNALNSLDWKTQAGDCESRWKLHLQVCKCKDHP